MKKFHINLSLSKELNINIIFFAILPSLSPDNDFLLARFIELFYKLIIAFFCFFLQGIFYKNQVQIMSFLTE